MMKRTFILALTLASGCAPEPITWTKSAFDMATFRKDDYTCTKEAYETRWGSSYVLYRSCMGAKGYNAIPAIFWTKPGFDTTTFHQDDRACIKEANETSSGSFDTLYRACMGARGYTAEE